MVIKNNAAICHSYQKHLTLRATYMLIFML